MPDNYSFFHVCKEYFADTAILPLFAIAVIWLIRKWNRDKKQAFFVTAVISICLLYNGAVSFLAAKVGEADTYYRFFWICPMVLIIALFVVELLFHTEGTKRTGMIVVLCMAAFLFSSKLPSTWVNIPKNIYQLDSEVIEIADIIQELEDGNYIAMIDNGDISNTIRQYTSQIGFTELSLDSMDYILSGRNTNYIGRYLLEDFINNNSDYYVLKKEKPSVCRVVESIGLELAAESEKYYIYYRNYEQIQKESAWIGEQEEFYLSMLNLEYIQVEDLQKAVDVVYVSDFGTMENDAAYHNAIEQIQNMQPECVIINSRLSEQPEWYIEKKTELDAIGVPYYCNDQEIQVIEQEGFVFCLIDNLTEVSDRVIEKLKNLNEAGKAIVLVLSAELQVDDKLYAVVTAEDSQVVQVLAARKNEYYKGVLEGKMIQYATPTDNNVMFNVLRVKGK